MSVDTWIYGLKAADTDEVRYVGASVDPVVRRRSHIVGPASRVVAAWIQECQERGVEIDLVCLERVTGRSPKPGSRHPDVAEAEDRWIVRLLDENHRLLNIRRPKAPGVDMHSIEMEKAIQRGRDLFGTDQLV